jgi:tetratricopeptide (TPR) repeat protein
VPCLYRRGCATLLNRIKFTVVLFAVGTVLCLSRSFARASSARLGVDDEICDGIADFFLGSEDYVQAIQRHLSLVRSDPDNALAYYHLGFSYGMVGDHQHELDDYQKAVALGLSKWDLFLNLGLLYLESGQLDSAHEMFQLAELLAPYRSETHFNLGVLDERLGMYRDAEQQLLFSLALDRDQRDAYNSLAVVYAEEGDYQRAYQEWAELARLYPNYAPAHANLIILKKLRGAELRRAARLPGSLATMH